MKIRMCPSRSTQIHKRDERKLKKLDTKHAGPEKYYGRFNVYNTLVYRDTQKTFINRKSYFDFFFLGENECGRELLHRIMFFF